MAKVFVHVGPHKTGSTYLQKQLRQHADLLADHGVSYPDLRSPVFGHGVLARRLKGWGEPVTREEVDRLVTGDALVLSSENFVLLTQEQLERFRNLLAGHDVTVVFVLRSLAKVLPSHWQETVKHGNTQTLLEYLARVNGWIDGAYPHVVPSRQLDKLARVFGADALSVVPYERTDDLFQTFGQIVLGARSPVFDGDRSRVNPSFGPARVELVRQLNLRFHAAHGRTPGQHLRVAYVRNSGPFERSSEFEAFGEEFERHATTVRLSDDDPFVREEARRVRRLYGHRFVEPDGAEVHDAPRQTSETRCALSSTTLTAEAAASLDELYRVHEPRALELLGLRR